MVCSVKVLSVFEHKFLIVSCYPLILLLSNIDSSEGLFKYGTSISKHA